MRVTIDERTGDTVFEDDGGAEVTDAQRTPEQIAADRRSLAIFDDSYRTPEQITADARTADFWNSGRARSPAPEPVLDSDDFGMLELRGAQEISEYERLKESGQYKDDAVMRLRAMRATRGDETVRQYAWHLRQMRDQMLAQKVARQSGMGGTWKDYYVPTTLRDIRDASERSGPGSGLVAFAARKDAELAFGRESGSASERLAAKRRARYMAARWGLKFDEETVPDPDGGYVDRPLRVAADGWMYGAGARVRERAEPDGSLTRQWLPRNGEDRPHTETTPANEHDYAPFGPGRVARYKNGRPIMVLPAQKQKVTGKWRLRAKRDPWAPYDGRR